MSLLWIFAYLVAERFFELGFSHRNLLRLQRYGGREFHRETFKYIAALHTLFLVSLLIVTYPWHIPLDPLTWIILVVLALLQGVRYWCMASLGENWNVRIVLIEGGAIKQRGPYRYMRHPNYLVVVLEFALIPLLMRAPLPMYLFFFANLVILRQRISLEEAALRSMTDYSERFPEKS